MKMLDAGLNMPVHYEEKKITFPDASQMTITFFEGSGLASDVPVFLILPALGVRSGFYNPLALSMAATGWNAVTMDYRGTGSSSVKVDRHSDFGFNEILTIDLPHIIKEIKDRFPTQSLYLMGHSLGGQLALLYASFNEQKIDKVILLTGGSNYYKNLNFFHGRVRWFNYRLIQAVTAIFSYFPGDKFGFAGKESKGMIKDWLKESLTGHYHVIKSSKDFEQLLKTIRIPVLFITLEGDHYVTPKCAAFLSKKLVNAQITLQILKASDYHLPRFTHFNWRKTPEPIVDTLEKWLEHS